jgi:hypothetical protein
MDGDTALAQVKLNNVPIKREQKQIVGRRPESVGIQLDRDFRKMIYAVVSSARTESLLDIDI